MFRKKKRYILTVPLIGILILVLLSDHIITDYSNGKTFDTLSELPKHKVGLVLGTSKLLKDGNLNLFFKYRIDATVSLYNSGKIAFVLVSGDNGQIAYNEPSDFKDALVERGIPAQKIFLDYAGFSTLDSMIRAKKIFGLDSVIVISQKFHNEREVYLAGMNDLVATGYNAIDVSGKHGIKTHLREYLARTKAVFDVLFHKQPKFLGPKVSIP
ncbi:SanA/YdcF family protein [Robertkochia solimangrovi]|uniref:SanA/YdcF family protein n=1 Tax=Robertkochia solimangrovi TaxID=2213046 RepID=UPI00117D0028|nr:ElyC/SanA/YdcF family protein [Robertkochia solimangrovi]TRZ43205.1 vancomycin high temperature exclusion protein [Robertkochia solimangrovi]